MRDLQVVDLNKLNNDVINTQKVKELSRELKQNLCIINTDHFCILSIGLELACAQWRLIWAHYQKKIIKQRLILFAFRRTSPRI